MENGITPELLSEVMEIRLKLAKGEIEPMSIDDLDKVSGGANERVPLDTNRLIGGWTFTELYNVLCELYKSYITDTDFKTAKDITLNMAVALVPSPFWHDESYDVFPDFISEPMIRLWTSQDGGFY